MNLYQPLYINGKRDKARRYVNPSTGEIISRRRYIMLTEGVSPEEKAIRRVKEGKAKPGKTYKRYLERKAKKEKKAKVRPLKRTKGRRIPEKIMRTGGEKGYFQLQGTYRFINLGKQRYANAKGYSLVTKTKYPYESSDYLIRRHQAIEHAAAKLPGYGWEYAGVIEEAWLIW